LRVHPEVLQAAKCLLAWGADNALAWREAPAYNGTPIHLTGNGRIDLMRPELRSLHEAKAKELRAKYGRIVLVNTNFGLLNHYYTNLTALAPPKEVGATDNTWRPDSPAIATVFRASWLAPSCSPLSKNNIHLRPHPMKTIKRIDAAQGEECPCHPRRQRDSWICQRGAHSQRLYHRQRHISLMVSHCLPARSF
jgi:surface carbohydrate biosynthesis protein